MLDFSKIHSAINGILDLGMTSCPRLLHASDAKNIVIVNIYGIFKVKIND